MNGHEGRIRGEKISEIDGLGSFAGAKLFCALKSGGSGVKQGLGGTTSPHRDRGVGRALTTWEIFSGSTHEEGDELWVKAVVTR